MSPIVLILGGTSEAYDLAARLNACPGWRVISSLAGRTDTPRLPVGMVRMGGFGGADGLAAYLRDHHVAAVVDCTHPFAARMGWNAAQGCAAAGVPLLRLERPAWVRQQGDRWHQVDQWPQAVEYLAAHSTRVLLAVGRQDIEHFSTLDHLWFLIRSVQEPDIAASFARADILLARGPFTLQSECDLLTHHRIDTILCKNSGGPTDAKLLAARQLGIQVVMKNRPPRPTVPTVSHISQVDDWLKTIGPAP